MQPGDSVAYRIVPICGADPAHLDPSEALASDWSAKLAVTSQDDRNISAYFNRGIIAAQWVARELAAEAQAQAQAQAQAGTPRAELMKAIADPTNALRKALGGLLRAAADRAD